MPPDQIFAPGFQQRPWWWEAAEPPARDNVLPDHAEVAIVGGGYAGLSAALTLQRLGHRVVVLDAERIGWGASSRNGGMVSGGLKVASAGLQKAHGPEEARRIALAAAASFPFLEETLQREGIECDYVRCGRFVGAWSAGHYQAMAKRVDWLAEVTGLPAGCCAGAPARGAGQRLLPWRHDGGGDRQPASRQVCAGLADAAERAGALLVDHVRVQGIGHEGSGVRIATSRGELRADTVLVATNGYSLDPRGTAMPWLARRVVPLASYIIATEELPEGMVDRLFPGRRMISDSKRVLNYFRPSPDGKRILWGGRASFRAVDAVAAAPVLHAQMAAVFPETAKLRITHAWNGNVAFTFDYLPHIGVQDGIHYAAGCQAAASPWPHGSATTPPSRWRARRMSASRSMACPSRPCPAMAAPLVPAGHRRLVPAARPAGQDGRLMPAPDFILLNGRVATMDAAGTTCTALAALNGRIVALGDDAAIRDLVGPGTAVLDAEGRRVLPGIVDSHAHPDAYAIRLRTWTLVSPDRVRSREELLRTIRDRCAALPPGRWAAFYRLNERQSGGYPSLAELDAASLGRPVFILRTDGHLGLANSAAFAAAASARTAPTRPSAASTACPTAA
jgi:glycine/D-amino acid oxidase-like deaminating enzyme